MLITQRTAKLTTLSTNSFFDLNDEWKGWFRIMYEFGNLCGYSYWNMADFKIWARSNWEAVILLKSKTLCKQLTLGLPRIYRNWKQRVIWIRFFSLTIVKAVNNLVKGVSNLILSSPSLTSKNHLTVQELDLLAQKWDRMFFTSFFFPPPINIHSSLHKGNGLNLRSDQFARDILFSSNSQSLRSFIRRWSFTLIQGFVHTKYLKTTT